MGETEHDAPRRQRVEHGRLEDAVGLVPDLVAPLLVGHEQHDVRGPGHGRRLGPCRDDEDRAVGASRPHGYRGRGGGRCGATGGTGRIPTGCGTRMIRIHWLVKGLGPGGAERLLVAAAAHHDRTRFSIACTYLVPWKSQLAPELEALGVATRCLDVRDERDVRWAARLRRDLTRRPVDVLHAHSPYPAGIGRIVARTMPRATRPPTVYTLHNTWESFARPTRLLNEWTMRADAADIAVSELVRSTMPPRLARRDRDGDPRDRPRRRPPPRRSRPGPRRARNRAGRDGGRNRRQPARPEGLSEPPGRGRSSCRDRGRPIRILAVGQGPLEAEIRDEHRRLALDGVVDLLGERADAVTVMSACDAFVLASNNEGLPVAVMEALALGLPVVATRVGGLSEAIDDTCGLLVPPRDPERARRRDGDAARRRGAPRQRWAPGPGRRRRGSTSAAPWRDWRRSTRRSRPRGDRRAGDECRIRTRLGRATFVGMSSTPGAVEPVVRSVAGDPIPFNRPSLEGDEIELMRAAVMQSGHTSADGPYSARAAELLRAEVGAHDVLLTTSCTAALEMTRDAAGHRARRHRGRPVVRLRDHRVGVRPPGRPRAVLRHRGHHARPRSRATSPSSWTTVGARRRADPLRRRRVRRRRASATCSTAWPRAELVEDNAHGLFGRYATAGRSAASAASRRSASTRRRTSSAAKAARSSSTTPRTSPGRTCCTTRAPTAGRSSSARSTSTRGRTSARRSA